MGKGYSKKAIISSIAVAIIILFYPLTIGSFLQPDVYRFKDRTTFHQFFENNYIFSQFIDNLVVCLFLIVWFYVSFQENKLKRFIVLSLGIILATALLIHDFSFLQYISLVSFPLILAIYFANKNSRLNLIRQDSNVIAPQYFMISFLVLIIVSSFHPIYNLEGDQPLIDIMTLLSRFAPALMFLLFISAFIRLISDLTGVLPIQRLKVTSLGDFFAGWEHNIVRAKKMILLSSFMILSVVIVLTPHLDGLMDKVSEDTTLYSEWIKDVKSLQNAEDFYLFIIGGTSDRPLTLLILYSIVMSLNDNVVIAFEIILPALLAPLLVLCTYFLTKEISGSSLVALCSSFITAVSFQIMIGVYAGFYANWIALILGYFSLWCAVRIINAYSRKYVVWFTISMIALMLSHSYTWTIITVFLIIFLIIVRWKKICGPRQFRVILIIVMCLIAFDVARNILPGSYSAIQRDVAIAQSIDENLFQLSARWSILVRTVDVFLGGIFGNVIVLMLALYFVAMYRFKNLASYFSLTFLSLGVLTLFFGDKIVQSRVLYDIPFQIPAGVSLAHIFLSKNGKLKSIVIGISLIAIAFYTMTNLGIAPR